MTFRADLYTLLTGDAGLSALVGSRIYPEQTPQNPTMPYIVWYEFANPMEQNLNCAVAVERPRIQFSTYSQSYTTSLNVVKALKAALLTGTWPIVIEDERGGADMTSGLHRRDLDVRVSYVGE